MTDIAIEAKRYVELLKAEKKLNMLEAAGVDNWDWYGDALNPEADGEMSYWKICEQIDAEYSNRETA